MRDGRTRGHYTKVLQHRCIRKVTAVIRARTAFIFDRGVETKTREKGKNQRLNSSFPANISEPRCGIGTPFLRLGCQLEHRPANTAAVGAAVDGGSVEVAGGVGD